MLKTKDSVNSFLSWKNGILLFLLIAVFAIILNFAVSAKSFFRVAGDESSWLLFWGNIVGAAASFFMAIIALMTLRNTISIFKNQELLKWSEDFKKASVLLQNSIDYFSAKKVCILISLGEYEKAYDYSERLFERFNSSINELQLDLSELEILTGDKPTDYISGLNHFLKDYVFVTAEINQLALVAFFLSKKEDQESDEDGKKMIEEMEPLFRDNNYKRLLDLVLELKNNTYWKDAIYNTAQSLLTDFNLKVNTNKVLPFLNDILKKESSKKYSFVFTNINGPISKVED